MVVSIKRGWKKPRERGWAMPGYVYEGTGLKNWSRWLGKALLRIYLSKDSKEEIIIYSKDVKTRHVECIPWCSY